MFSITEWLDRAEARQGNITDYRLAKILGISSAAISGYRAGIRFPDERIAVKLCALSGDDPEYVVACLQSMRAANDDSAQIWQRVAQRLAGGAHVVALAVALALISAAQGDGAAASALPSLAVPVSSLYIMSTVLLQLARILWFIGRWFLAHRPPAQPFVSQPSAHP